MKTLPLDEILKQIGPLPYRAAIAPPQFKRKMNIETRLGDRVALVDEGSFWDCGEHSASQGGNRSEAQAAYLAHAANVLPELVEALELASRELAARQAVNKAVCERGGIPFKPCEALASISAALTKATQVPIA